jgi:signal transduction histidine kinase
LTKKATATAQEKARSAAAAPAAGGPDNENPSVTFPQIARLELDDLLEQLVERAQDVLNTQGRLRGLLAANRAIASDLGIDALLLRITQSACELVGARYGALGVVGSSGELDEFITVGLDDDTRAAIGPLPRGKGILGLLISDPQALRLDDLKDHPKSVGFPPNHPPMHSFVGVPIRVRDLVFGNLYLTEKLHGAGFTAEDEELLTALASAAGVAIDNARLYEVERRRQRWLSASAEISRELLAGNQQPLPLIATHAREVADADLALLLVPVPEATDMLLVAAAAGKGAELISGRLIPRDQSLAGRAIAEETTVLVQDVGREPNAYQLPGIPNGPALFVRIADAGQGQPGVLSLTRARGAPAFDPDHQDMIASFADQAGVALKLAHAQSEQRRLLLLEDRDRIARDLHDHVIQRLFAAGLGLTGLAARTQEPVTRARLGEYTDQLDDTIGAIRQAIFELRQADQTSLQARVIAAVREISPALGFTPELRFEGPLDTLLNRQIGDHVLAVVREGLINAAKHAAATGIAVSVSAIVSDRLTVIISDDGTGLGQPVRISGLANMRSRAEELGGTLTTVSPTGPGAGGTRLEWTVPLDTGIV